MSTPKSEAFAVATSSFTAELEEVELTATINHLRSDLNGNFCGLPCMMFGLSSVCNGHDSRCEWRCSCLNSSFKFIERLEPQYPITEDATSKVLAKLNELAPIVRRHVRERWKNRCVLHLSAERGFEPRPRDRSWITQ